MIRYLLGHIGLWLYPVHRQQPDGYHRRDDCPRCAARRWTQVR